MVAFLYFIESCSGSLTPETIHPENKLIVIGDPISSLSHNYIYEVAALIKRKIIKAAAAEHVVILTIICFLPGDAAEQRPPAGWQESASKLVAVSHHQVGLQFLRNAFHARNAQ